LLRLVCASQNFRIVGTTFVSPSWFLVSFQADEEETKMLRIVALSGALATGMLGGAFAQGTGPAAQADDLNKPALLNTNSLAVKKTVTTGALAPRGFRPASDIGKTESAKNREVSLR
jgi:hypothetical protein